eukprot:NODE_297_length_10490_cov_1.102974.p3 type:complete len:361 gc:universal NODE_297_length_10490_cov_1.102974:243-1325(+)
MSDLSNLDIEGAQELKYSNNFKIQSAGQCILKNIIDLKMNTEVKHLKAIAVFLDVYNLADSVKTQVIDIIDKCRVATFIGPPSLASYLKCEIKRLLLIGCRNEFMYDIIEELPILKLSNCSHVALCKVSVKFDLLGYIIESENIKSFECIDVQILNIPITANLKVSKTQLTILNTQTENIRFEFETAILQELRTDLLEIFSCVKGHLKNLVTLNITFKSENCRVFAKLLMLCKNLQKLTTKISNGNLEHSQMVLNSLCANSIEWIEISPSFIATDIFLRNYKMLQHIGCISFPFPLIKNISLKSLSLNEISTDNFPELIGLINFYNIREIYVEGEPKNIKEFQKRFEHQLKTQNCNITVQ